MALLPKLHAPHRGRNGRDAAEAAVVARLPDLLDEHDPLTGLLNRSSFTARVEVELERAVKAQLPVTLVCFRLDLFGAVHQNLSHLAGVRLFRDVSQRLLSCTRGSDLVGRLGDDEFAILLPGSEFEAGLAVSMRAKAKLERPYELDHGPVPISVVFGIASYPECGARYAHELVEASRAVAPAPRPFAPIGPFRA